MILEECGDLESYSLLDSGDEMRLERFGDFVLARPDPAVLWHKTLSDEVWNSADATFIKDGEERGQWHISKEKQVPSQWPMQYSIPGTTTQLSFVAKLSPFKHTGVFPEQVSNWNFMASEVKKHVKSGGVPADIRVLNLFGYTGIASVLLAKLGCSVTHVDASKPSVAWAKENMIASGLEDDAIRWILDDCLKFVKRESRRASTYDAIIMDPPAFGRGAKGEVWKFNEHLPELFELLPSIVSQNFKFLIVNAYAVSVSSLLLKNLIQDFAVSAKIENPTIEYGELILQPKMRSSKNTELHSAQQNNNIADGKSISTGIFGRLSR